MSQREEDKGVLPPGESPGAEEPRSEERRGFLAKTGLAVAALGLAAGRQASAQDCGPREPAFGRRARYVVMPVEAVRVNNIRTDSQVVEAQKRVDDDMIRALEEMVNAARAGTLENAALAIGAIAW